MTYRLYIIVYHSINLYRELLIFDPSVPRQRHMLVVVREPYYSEDGMNFKLILIFVILIKYSIWCYLFKVFAKLKLSVEILIYQFGSCLPQNSSLLRHQWHWGLLV